VIVTGHLKRKYGEIYYKMLISLYEKDYKDEEEFKNTLKEKVFNYKKEEVMFSRQILGIPIFKSEEKIAPKKRREWL
jgi:hypothetical protein